MEKKEICKHCGRDLGEDGSACEEVLVCWDCASVREEYVWDE